MDAVVASWKPNQEELDRILAEMRPIIDEFVRRARQQIQR
jgi:hypothetical protein